VMLCMIVKQMFISLVSWIVAKRDKVGLTLSRLVGNTSFRYGWMLLRSFTLSTPHAVQLLRLTFTSHHVAGAYITNQRLCLWGRVSCATLTLLVVTEYLSSWHHHRKSGKSMLVLLMAQKESNSSQIHLWQRRPWQTNSGGKDSVRLNQSLSVIFHLFSSVMPELTTQQAFFNVMLKDFGVKGVKVQEVFGLDDDLLAMLP